MPDDPFQLMIDALSGARRVLITTHVRPDGDALGSTAAMAMALRGRGISTQQLLLSHLPSKYAFVYESAGIDHLDVEKGFPTDFSMDSFDTLLVVDTGTWSQLPGLKDRVASFTGQKLVIDHHLTQEEWAHQKLVITTAPAAGEIVADLIDRWGMACTSPMAGALFVALVADTGWFQFSSTRPHTLRLAARLLEAGVNIDDIYQRLYQNERSQRLSLQTRGLRSLELLADNFLAVTRLTKQDFQETGAGPGDSENLINIPMQIRTVGVSLLFNEPTDKGPIRVSLRSKGQVDVARFAQQFGGGGHARAAGLKVDGTLDQARETVVAAMLDQLARIGVDTSPN